MRIKVFCLVLLFLSESFLLAEEAIKPTIITSITGEEIALWPSQLPSQVAENLESVVPIWVDVISTDKDKPLPPNLSRPMWGSGLMVRANDECYILSVSHTFTTNLMQIMEVTKYTQKILTISPSLIVRCTTKYENGELRGDILGKALELIAYEPEPYDFAVFKIILPKRSMSSDWGTMGYPKIILPSLTDWPSLENDMPNLARYVKAAKPLRIARPNLGELVYLTGYVFLDREGLLAYHTENFISKINENLIYQTGERKITIKKHYILRGQSSHGLSGSFVFSKDGFVGILQQGTEYNEKQQTIDGVELVASSDDFVDFLERRGLEFLIDKDLQ